MLCDLTVTPTGCSKQSNETFGPRKDSRELLSNGPFVLFIINAKTPFRHYVWRSAKDMKGFSIIVLLASKTDNIYSKIIKQCFTSISEITCIEIGNEEQVSAK